MIHTCHKHKVIFSPNIASSCIKCEEENKKSPNTNCKSYVQQTETLLSSIPAMTYQSENTSHLENQNYSSLNKKVNKLKIKLKGPYCSICGSNENINDCYSNYCDKCIIKLGYDPEKSNFHKDKLVLLEKKPTKEKKKLNSSIECGCCGYVHKVVSCCHEMPEDKQVSASEPEMVKMIDPPSGWMYGFPKPYTPEKGETMIEWLEKQGYPTKKNETLLKLATRFWNLPINNE